MKILFILVSNIMDPAFINNISHFSEFIQNFSHIHSIDVAAISSFDDFHNYEHIISFKYKIVNPYLQLSKVCDFFSTFQDLLLYDWFIKFRPEIKFLQPLDFNLFSINAINARARVYHGHKSIPFGASVGGPGHWSGFSEDFSYNSDFETIVLDDQVFIFHRNIILAGAFYPIQPYSRQDEWVHSNIWSSRNISLNVVGFLSSFARAGDFHIAFSGNIN